jgi:hypothetical protein
MIIIVRLVILVAAVAGVAGNGGSAHAQPLPGARLRRDRLRRPLFLYGIVAVAIAMLGLSLLLASARRTARRGRAARRGLRQSRRETAVAAHDRDDLLDQRDTARAYTASSLGSDTPAGSRHPRQPPMSIAKTIAHKAETIKRQYQEDCRPGGRQPPPAGRRPR